MDLCRTIEENPDEGPYWRGACPGYPGWRIEWYESDLRQGLELIDKSGRKTDLHLSEVVAHGAFNNLLGAPVEWRGPSTKAPDTLIVRMGVDQEEEGRPQISRLAVVRLSPTPCIIGVVEPSSAQNAKARAIADGTKRDCLTE
ncbi:hypothetical protein [Sphingomonas daechungensis]|uniref:hypothetical protein n=1 Tax=Sphingomonas daechungensis TaxID=1176646 RepID=UPI0031EA80C2